MNKLSHLPKIIKRAKKRLGRGLGSGVGAKSTRGTKRHQSAKETIPIHFEGGQNRLVKRLPLLAGKGKNKSIVQKPLIVRISQLESFTSGTTIDIPFLIDKNIVSKDANRHGVKIVADSDTIKNALTVVVHTTKMAKKLIEQSGGAVLTKRL